MKARLELQDGAYNAKKEPTVCKQDFDTLLRLATTLKPKDEDDMMLKDPERFAALMGPQCLAKAGDCAGAFEMYKKGAIAVGTINGHPVTGNEAYQRSGFESSVPRCKGK